MPKLKDPNVWFQNALKVTEDPAASGWLKNALSKRSTVTLSTLLGMRRSSTEFLDCEPLQSKRRNSRARKASRLRQRRRRGLSRNSHPAHDLADAKQSVERSRSVPNPFA